MLFKCYKIISTMYRLLSEDGERQIWPEPNAGTQRYYTKQIRREIRMNFRTDIIREIEALLGPPVNSSREYYRYYLGIA